MKPILRAGLIVGTQDILAACLHYYLKTHDNPIMVLRFVASGIFGDDAYRGSSQMAIWGFLFHYIIAFAFTLLFFLLYRRVQFIRLLGIFSGIVYGAFMWSITQFIVIPLSRIPNVAPLTFSNAVIAISILIVCIGVPLYYMARKAHPIKTQTFSSRV